MTSLLKTSKTVVSIRKPLCLPLQFAEKYSPVETYGLPRLYQRKNRAYTRLYKNSDYFFAVSSSSAPLNVLQWKVSVFTLCTMQQVVIVRMATTSKAPRPAARPITSISLWSIAFVVCSVWVLFYALKKCENLCFSQGLSLYSVNGGYLYFLYFSVLYLISVFF